MWRFVAVLIGVMLSVAAPAAGSPRLFTLAGVESTAMRACWPLENCRGPAWVATQRRLTGGCLTALADGTILLCERGRLFALAADGRLREWPLALDAGVVLDADVAPDDSVVVLGSRGVARIGLDGSFRILAALDPEGRYANVTAMPDGGAIASTSQGLLRIASNGTATTLPLSGVLDVSALPDGAVAVTLNARGRVLRLSPDGTLGVVAGGGRGFREGAVATDVALDRLTGVAAASDRTLLIAAGRGVLRLGRDGRISTVVRGAAAAKFLSVGEPGNADADGLPVAAARVRDVLGIHAMSGGQALVMTTVPGRDRTVRVALITERPERLAVALPGRNRTLLLRGHAEIVATRAAVGRVQVRQGRRVVASRRVALRRGRTRIRVRVPTSDKVHVMRVLARSRDGAIASHQISVIPGRRLAGPVVRRLEDYISLVNVDAESDAWITCRRRTPWRFGCRAEYSSGGETVWANARLRLRDDGLIAYSEPATTEREAMRLVFEPLTYNPRPG
jgi:hypothetical protein